MGKGPRVINGYYVVYHPEAIGAFPAGRNEGYVYEHRYIMEEILGHRLQDNEVVHHIDGNKLNNHPDNLMWLDTGQHTKLHNRLRQLENGYELKDKRCLNCDRPVAVRNNYCSIACKNIMLKNRKNEKIKNFHNALDAYIRMGFNYARAGKLIGVTDNCIKKRINNITFEELNSIDIKKD